MDADKIKKGIKFEDFEELTMEYLERNKEVPFQIFVETDIGWEVYVMQFQDDEEKEDMFMILRDKIQSISPRRYFSIQEGWMGSNPNYRPSQDKNRRECLMIMEYRKDLHHKGKIHIFSRTKAGKIKWGEVMDIKKTEFNSRLNFYLEDASKEWAFQSKVDYNLKKLNEILKDKDLEEFVKDYHKATGQKLSKKVVREQIEKLIKSGKYFIKEDK